MRATADTSRDAYRAAIASGRTTEGERAVLRAFHADPSRRLTRAEIGELTRLRSGSVCGRVFDLIEAGILIQLPRRRCTVTGDRAHEIALVPLQRQLFEEAA